ncbi:unnamed protein product [Fraxinus pennsylvanica]|uniref:Uncharacterized protein n=1 Tax=Fraxinus pennsylvanica TaxID=56036 RepID=A0AAD1ZSR3_9LAMI|nr:unnamed protein product [Fraxinus pennsylvanica]
MEPGTWCTDGEVCCLRSYSSTRNYDRFVGYDGLPSISKSKAPIWTQLWRKIKKEKKKRVFACSNSSMRFTYDPYSYAQNFDQSSDVDHDDLISRSFSARFAVPSGIFEKNILS